MLTVFHSALEIQSALANKKEIGFVPTMGNLHPGHLSLIKKSLQENNLTVISIYVNPTQFAIGEDFNDYPRTLTEDVAKIKKILSHDDHVLVFAPTSDAELYPHGKKVITATGPCDILEGSLRAGHFDGVVTIVKKLFELIAPHRAYFGKKDYQQYVIIRELVKMNQWPIQIIGMPIIREASGIAMSSRNSFLSPHEMLSAIKLRETLLQLKSVIMSKNYSLTQINQQLADYNKDPNFNYLALHTQESLAPVSTLNQKIILLGNYQLGTTKLLDNIEFEGPA